MTSIALGVLNGIVVKEYPLSKFDGDVIYEVIRLIQGRPLFLKEHVERLEYSLISRGITEKISCSDIRFLIHRLRDAERLDNHNVKLLVRKVGDHLETLIFYNPTYYPEESLYEMGVHTVKTLLYRDEPNVKKINTSFTEQIAKIKEEKNAFECIVVHDGVVTEGSRSNLFFYKDETFYTADTAKVLVGITRNKIIEAIGSLGYKVVEAPIPLDSIESFEGAFISGTSLGVLPVDTIDEAVYGSSNIKAIQDLRMAYEKIMVNDINGGK